MGLRTLDRSFTSGEITPELYGRIDLASFQTGLALCRNFEVLPHGPVANRPGTEFVREVKTSAKRTRLIPFTYSTTQTMVLEFGENYIRFHTNGGTLLSGGVPYEVVTTYAEAHLFDIHYVQSADVMTLVHPLYAPRELRRLGGTSWTLTPITFASSQTYLGGLVSATSIILTNPIVFPPPPAFAYCSSGFPGADSRKYFITAFTDDPRTNGAARAATIVGIDATQVINIKWGAVGGAIGYRVWRETTPGNYFQIAETSLLEFDDIQTAPNTNIPLQGLPPTPNQNLYEYVATAVGADGQESVASLVCNATSDLTFTGSYIAIETLFSLIQYESFNVYKKGSGGFGYIGSAPYNGVVFDDNIEPDMTRQPPVDKNPFPTAGNYPQAVSYFEQRRLFAGTLNLPQSLWGTRTGTESNMNTNVVTRDTDAISFRIASREANTIRHIVALGEAILLTSSAVWRVTSSDGGALTPATLSVKVQSYTGASNVQPQVTDSSILYAQARGGHIREIVYTRADNGAVGYSNTDMSLLAPHLFNFRTISDMAFAKAPYPILWAVSSDGRLLGMTYVPEQKVAGWHQHDTDGLFESCAVVTEGEEDMLYVVVKRTINGSSKRYVERLHSRQFQNLRDAFFVDCGDTYSGAPATVISGLGHLEGKQVAVLGDGAVFPLKTVSGGAITLEKAVSVAQVGLPITADIMTLPMSTEQVAAFGQGRAKNVNKVYIRVFESSIVKAGPSATKLREYKQRTTEPYDSPPSLMTKEIEIPLEASWGAGAQVMVRQTDPLPLTILSMSLDTAVGG